jgi:hypothetical protein
MPKLILNSSQRMTIGAKQFASFPVPNGWIAKTSTMMAHEIPTTVELVMLGFTTVILSKCQLMLK